MRHDDLVKPPALRKGDLIGVVAPSSPFDPRRLLTGIRFLQARGMAVRCLPGLFKRRKGFLAGEDAHRAEELRLMFEDPEVKGVFTARGGYGAQRLLDRLDPEVIRRNPKIFLGYSDVSCLHFFLLDKCGLVSFHGPLVIEMGALSRWTELRLFRALTRPEPPGDLSLPDARWIRKGVVRGPLVGGNLTILCSSLGTPWEPETEGRVVLLEDRGEKPYRIDRMLVQLRQAGKLSCAAAVVFGDLLTGKDGGTPRREKRILEEVIHENTRSLGVPVVCGLPVGHGRRNLTLPLGVRVEVNGRRNRFRLLESGVSPRE